MTLLINIQINLLFKRKFPIELTSKFGNLVWPNARAALVLSASPMFYTGFESLTSVDGLCRDRLDIRHSRSFWDRVGYDHLVILLAVPR
jgi:hypothetical protein